MRDKIRISTKDELKNWLKDKPTEWAHTIALRAALRILPLMAYDNSESLHTELLARLHLNVFRAACVGLENLKHAHHSDVHRKYYSNYVTAASTSLNISIKKLIKSPAIAATVMRYAIDADAINSVFYAAKAAETASRSGFSAQTLLWRATARDCSILIGALQKKHHLMGENFPHTELLKSELWEKDDNVKYVLSKWKSFKDNQITKDFKFIPWIEWYEPFICTNGKEFQSYFNNNISTKISTQPDAWWDREVKLINSDIAIIVKKEKINNNVYPAIKQEHKESKPTTPSDYYKLITEDSSPIDRNTLKKYTALTFTSKSKMFEFTGVSRTDGVSEDEFQSALASISAQTGAQAVPDFQYTQDEPLTRCNQIFADSIPAEEYEGEADYNLDDVLKEIRTGERHDNLRDENVIIAVLDTGIDGTRLEFSGCGKMVGGWAPPPSRGSSESPSPWHDTDGHGTMCAVIAAGRKARDGGFRGVAPHAPLISGRSPRLLDSNFIAIYEHLLFKEALNGKKIIVTHSFGLGSTTPPTTAAPYAQLANILPMASSRGIHMVFSAGNLHQAVGGSPDTCVKNSIWQFKGLNDVLTVGACNMTGGMWDYSSRGPGQMPSMPGHRKKPDVVAPTPPNGLIASAGGDIVCPRGWGTSGAAPQVAGLLALLLTIQPDLPQDELYDIVRSTAMPLSLGSRGQTGGYIDACQGHGIINCEAAIDKMRSRHGVHDGNPT